MADTRPWKRGTAAARSANAQTSGAGDIGVETDTGNLVVGDGTTPWASLKRLLRVDEVSAAIQAYVVSVVVTNSTIASIVDSTGYVYVIVDQNGKIAFGVRPDGNVVAKISVADGTITKTQLAQPVQDFLPSIQYSAEAVYTWVDQNGRRSWLEIGPDGGPTVASVASMLTKMASGINALVATQVATLPLPQNTITSADTAYAIVDSNGARSELEVGPDGRFTPRVVTSIARRLPVSTTADPVTIVLPSTFDLMVGQTYRLNYPQIVAGLSSDHRIKVSGAPTVWGDFGGYWQYTPATPGTWTLTVAVRDRTGATITSKDVAVTVRAVPTSAVGATQRHLQVGDSITDMSEYVRLGIAAIPGATAVAPSTRGSGATATAVIGHSGWSLDSYFQNIATGDGSDGDFADSEFLFPTALADGSKFKGNTDFWRRVIKNAPGYQIHGYDKFARGWTTAGPYVFDATSGYPLAPTEGDVVVDPTKAVGSKWQIYTSGTWTVWANQPTYTFDGSGGVTFSFSKFLQRFAPAFATGNPSSIGIFLGTNGPGTVDLWDNEATWLYWKTRMDAFIASIRAWSPTVPIELHTVIERGRQSVLSGYQENEFDGDRRMRELARRVYAAYDTPAAVANRVYVVPFLGVVDKANITDVVHPDPVTGHPQMAPWAAGKYAKLLAEGVIA